ncbi:MAG: diaminopimelate epimerase [Lachnospiraceae bacterium]|nr:diaminopimelate epimerase [Lachnospiraceae bacterium]
MKFTKMHGCGNDYVYVDGGREHIDMSDKPEAVRRLSDRHTGIGGDGVIFINPSDVSDFEMEMWNADGTRSEMCGNGIRCVAKYVYDYKLTDKTKLDIVSAGSIKHIELYLGEDSKVERVRVDMGAPIFDPALVPIEPKDSAVNALNTYETGMCEASLSIRDPKSGEEITVNPFACVSMGNPHAITLVNDVQSADVHGTGPVVENHSFFPKRTNVEFIHVVDRSHIDMRVWERGTGETMACGTGACASAVACMVKGLCDSKTDVKLLGGTLTIEWDGTKEGHVFMTGPATEVFSGEVDI